MDEQWRKYLPKNYSYIYEKNEDDEFSFRVKELTDKPTSEVWLEEFSKASYTTWRVLKTYPNTGLRNVFRKDYRCQHATDKRASGTGPTKNTNCPVKLEIIIKRYIEKSKAKKVDHCVKEYPAIISMRGHHNHPIFSAESLKYRDMSNETKEKLNGLFRRGHNPSSALYSLKMDLMISSDSDYYKLAADGQFLPTLSIVTKLFKKEFEGEYGSFDGDDMFESLASILKEYESSGGRAKFSKTSDEENYFVVLCTPVMLRAHQKISQASELVLIDASGEMDKQRHRLYVFVTPTAAGGVPLGVIITDSEKESVFKEALIAYKELLPEDAFFGKKYPQVILTDNDMKERNALASVFPQTTLLLCQFHMLKSMWSWLTKANHDVESTKRQELYFLFKNVVYSFDEEQLNNNIVMLLKKIKELKAFKLETHLAWLLSFKEVWVSYFRKQLVTRGSNTTNYVEIVFRILKDIIFDRTLVYNLTQLVDFIITRYELYMKQRLTDFVNGKYSKVLLLKMLPKQFDVNSMKVDKENEEGQFKVHSEKETHNVDMIRGICSCSIGQSGKLCRHASVVFLNLEHSGTAFNIANVDTKSLMFFVANGTEPSLEWFKPLKDSQVKSGDRFSNFPEPLEENSVLIDESPKQNLKIDEQVDDHQSQIEDVKSQLQVVFDKILKGCSNNPKTFLPAAKKMLKNAAEFTLTETGLLSAMHTFGSYSGIKSSNQKCAKRLLQRSHKNVIGVQPTAIGRRKLLLSGRRRINVGRPSGLKAPPKELALHDYTTFGALPKRKRKAPHNLEQCVFDNKSLGDKKHKK